jgi:hypothetical protein
VEPGQDSTEHVTSLDILKRQNGNLAERKWLNWILRVRFRYTVTRFSTIRRVENLSSAALFKPKAPPNVHVPQVLQSRYTEATKEEKYEYILTVTGRYYSPCRLC